MKQVSTLCTALNFCLLKVFTCVECKCTAPIVPVKSCLTEFPMNILSRNVFVWIATVLCITKGMKHLLFYSAASAHIASSLEQVGIGVISDTDFLGLPLSSGLTCGPFLGLCASVCLLRNRWRMTIVAIKSAIPCKWFRAALDKHKVLLTSLDD